MCLAAILFVTNVEFVESEEDGVEQIIPEDDYPLSIGKFDFSMNYLIIYKLVCTYICCSIYCICCF